MCLYYSLYITVNFWCAYIRIEAHAHWQAHAPKTVTIAYCMWLLLVLLKVTKVQRSGNNGYHKSLILLFIRYQTLTILMNTAFNISNNTPSNKGYCNRTKYQAKSNRMHSDSQQKGLRLTQKVGWNENVNKKVGKIEKLNKRQQMSQIRLTLNP